MIAAPSNFDRERTAGLAGDDEETTFQRAM
jgi:hypothetical protein